MTIRNTDIYKEKMSHNFWMNLENYGHSAPAAMYCSSIYTTNIAGTTCTASH